MIDAEGDYEGKYAAADRYVRALRARIGADFPLSLAGFPYVDYHPAFPYSVFFGPGGATYNQPQMYWKAIGTSVRARLRAHLPLQPASGSGRSTRSARPTRTRAASRSSCFRRFAINYGGLAPSWWDWQETNRQRVGGARRRRPAGRSSATGRSRRTRC